MIEELMQNSQILINNRYELQSIVLTVLSKLTIVKFFDLGIRCFGTLRELMGAG